MGVPDVFAQTTDGNVGSLPEQVDKVSLLVGYASGLAANTLTKIVSKAQVDALGYGKCAESAMHTWEESGGPFYVLAPATSAGTNTSVTQPGSGSPPTVGVTGTPYNDFDIKVVMTLGGAVGTSKFKYTVDGGNTWVEDLFTASTYPLPGTGLTLTFAAGTYVVDHEYSLTSKAPSFSTVQMGAAIDAALLDPAEFGIVAIHGSPNSGTSSTDATASVAMLSALAAKLDAAENAHRFMRGVVECSNSEDADINAALAGFVNERCSLFSGYGLTQSSITGRIQVVNQLRVAVARLPRKKLGVDPAELNLVPGAGPLPPAVKTIEDESRTQLLPKCVTFRTVIGRTGYFVTNWPLLSGTGSDFRWLQQGQIVDVVCRGVRDELLRWLSQGVDTKPDGSGQLTEGQAKAIDTEAEARARILVVDTNDVQDIQVTTSRSKNVEQTEELEVEVFIKGKTFIKRITLKVGYTRRIVRAQ